MRKISTRVMLATGWLLSWGFLSTASAQVPAINGISPQAAAPGKTVNVKVRGGNLAAPTQFWSSMNATAALAADVPDNGKNAGEITYAITLPAEAPVGIHGLRVATMGGVSNLYPIMVDDLPSVAQVKPNALPAQAQAITLPAAVDGQMDGLSRNFYKFSVQANQSLSIEVVARRIGSPLDPMLRLFDAAGKELAYSDDAPGLAGDSRLSYTFPTAGEYLVEVRDIRFQGGGNFYYRLRMGDFPVVSTPFPMGIKRGAAANIAFSGPQIEGVSPVALTIPPENLAEWVTIGAKRAGGASSGFASLSVSNGEEAVETEPNNEQAQATRVPVGASVNGRLDAPGDVDRFIFTAKAGQHYLFQGVTRQQGAPTDLLFKILNPAGGQIAAADDNGPNEGVIDFTVPADGDYTLVVEDLNRRGGSEFGYRIEAIPFEMGFDLTLSGDTLNVPLKGVSTITVTSVRRGYNGPIDLALVNAPAGVSGSTAVIGPGLNTAVMTIVNDEGAPNGQIAGVQIVGKAKIGDKDFVAQATATPAQRAAMANTLLPPPNLAKSIALATIAQPFFVLRAEPQEIVFGKNLSATVKLKTTRAADFPEAITIAVEPAQNGLPGGITAAVKPIDKDKGEVEIVFTANPQAPLGLFSAVLQGTGKRGNDTVVQAAPAIRLALNAPYTLKTEFPDPKLVKGGMLKGKVVAERNPAYNGPIVLTFANLPKGVTAAAATIPEGQKEVEVVLTAAADAAVGAIENLVANGEGTAGGQKFTEAAPQVKLVVE